MNEVEAIQCAVNWAGSQARLGEMLGVRQGQISCWIHRCERIGSGYALAVHELTSGKVSAHDLRPDLYPRGLIKFGRHRSKEKS